MPFKERTKGATATSVEGRTDMLIKVRTEEREGGRGAVDDDRTNGPDLEGFTSKRGILPPVHFSVAAAATAHHIKATLIPSQLPLILCQN